MILPLSKCSLANTIMYLCVTEIWPTFESLPLNAFTKLKLAESLLSR